MATQITPSGLRSRTMPGLHRAGARHLRGVVWLTQDPLGLGPDVNPYRYVGNGPLNGVDPSGLAAPPPSGVGQSNTFSFRMAYGVPSRKQLDANVAPFDLVGTRENRDRIEQERIWLNKNGAHFEYKIDWILPRTEKGHTAGFIIQKVEVKYDFLRDGKRFSSDKPTPVPPVWEVWYVNDKGEMNLSHNFLGSKSKGDTLTTPIQRWGNKGWVEYRVSAVFVPLSEFGPKGEHGNLFYQSWKAPMGIRPDSHFQLGQGAYKRRTGIQVNESASIVEPLWWGKYSAKAINRSIKVAFDFTKDEKSAPATMTWR